MNFTQLMLNEWKTVRQANARNPHELIKSHNFEFNGSDMIPAWYLRQMMVNWLQERITRKSGKWPTGRKTGLSYQLDLMRDHVALRQARKGACCPVFRTKEFQRRFGDASGMLVVTVVNEKAVR